MEKMDLSTSSSFSLQKKKTNKLIHRTLTWIARSGIEFTYRCEMIAKQLQNNYVVMKETAQWDAAGVFLVESAQMIQQDTLSSLNTIGPYEK